jgi:DnaJ-class molecular chaperone
LKGEAMLTKEKVQEILEEVFSDYVRVEDADAQKVYDGLMEMLSEQAVEHTLAPDATLTCPACDGVGYEKRSYLVAGECQSCKGAGHVKPA